jgi:hypothetical protein
MKSMNTANAFSISPRTDKTITWLIESRDQWKIKCLQAKLKLKRQTLALKRIRDSRLQQKKLLKALKEKNRELELTVQSQQNQLLELKKKPS